MESTQSQDNVWLEECLEMRIQPYFMYGTAWKEERTEACVTNALQAGFRAIDTANQRKHYYEAGVGAALKAAYDSGLVTRDDLFLQTKFTYQRGQDHRLPYDPNASYQTQVRQSFESSLQHLHTDKLDSYVLHGPAASDGLIDADHEVWREMEQLHSEGLVSVLGVSNVSATHLEQLLEFSQVKIQFVQNRCYAQRGWDQRVRELCQAHNIVYQGFSLLTANRFIPKTELMATLTKRYQKTWAQIVFRFARQIGMLPLTGTTSPTHMAEDLDVEDFELSESELAEMLKIGL